MAIKLQSLNQISHDVAKRARQQRLRMNLTQKTLADMAGISLGKVKQFEQSGQISLKLLLKLALVLNGLDGFNRLFENDRDISERSLDHLLNQHQRERGRK